jgi:predicted dehydrogenase
MSKFTRRDFLNDAALLAAAGAALGAARPAAADVTPIKKVGANDRIRMAVIGFRGQGHGHLKAYASLPDTEVVTICDVDTAQAKRGLKTVTDIQKREPVYVQDLRRIMDDKTIDAVSIATPNHWHALAGIWAVLAGKDVYVEKPISHNVWEGRRLVDLARKHGKIVQCGTQSRSNEGMRQTIDYVQSGKIGKVTIARGLCYKNRPSIGPRKEAAIPETIDYDLWCGPAPVLPSYRNGIHGPVHYDWHWTWEYGNGDLGNQGIHEMDKARWGLNKPTLPTGVFSLGGRFGYTDAGDTANTQLCFFDYGDAQLIFEVRGLPTKDFKGAKVGNVWHGTEGYVVSTNYNSGAAFTPDGELIKKFEGGGSHFANFIKACKSRKHTDLNADCEDGHLSSALCHLGNISYRLGTPQKAQAIAALHLPSDFQDGVDRMLSHLRDNKVDVASLDVQIGRKLRFNPTTEKFADDVQADAMLTRNYRKGFEVPA